MNTKRFYSFLTIIAILGMLAVTPQPAQAIGATIYVPDNYPTIQGAVNAANPGDTVHVRAGTYASAIVVNKAIRLEGEGLNNTTIDGAGTGIAIALQTNGATLSAFKVVNSNVGIQLTGASNNTLDHLWVVGTCGAVCDYGQYGIAFRSGSNYNQVSDTLVSNAFMGIDGGDQGSHHNTFLRAEAFNNVYGITSYAASDYLTITDSNAHDNTGAGIQIGWSSNWLVSGTTITNNSYGLVIDTASYGTASDNNITNNTMDGVHFNGWGPVNNNIIGNRIQGNGQAGLLFQCTARSNTITDNEISGNAKGVWITRNGTCPNYGNTFHHNTFSNNTVNAQDDEERYGGNTWDNGYPSGGNTWDNYTGVDQFSGASQDVTGADGIGDTPYVILADLDVDHYPMMSEHPDDFIAPVTEAVLGGIQGNNGWYTSDVQVTLSALDNEGGVGVLKTEYSLDGGIWQEYIQPFTVTKEGITTVLYRSIDKANNQEQDKTLEIKIDKTEPTLRLTDIIGFGSANESQGTSDNPVMFRMDTEGNILWKKDLPFEDFDMTQVLADRNLAEDTVYLFISAGGTNLMDGKGQLQKYNMYGDLVWSLPLTTGSTGATVSADPVGGGAYVASDEGIWRVGVAGNVLWGPKTLGFGTGAGEWAVATDVLTGGAYAARNNGNILLKLDNQGNLLWQQSISNPYKLNFSPTDGGVYVGSGTWGNDHVHKFDSQGNQQWVMNNFPSPWTYWRTVSSVDGALYIWSGWNEYLAKIMPDGTVAWSTLRSGGWGNASVAADIEQNKVYTTEIFERLGVTTFNGSTGALLWQKDPGYYAPHWASDDYGPWYWVYTGMRAQTLPDTTPPTITPAINGVEGNHGWYTSDVTVNWDVSDPESEIASSIGCDTTTLIADTTGDTLTCSATNGVGLSHSVSVTILIDKTAPTIAASNIPALPASGWWNIASGAPTVSFVCSDATSGLAGPCPEAYTFPDGENQSYSQTIYDNAGNSASDGVSNIDVDLIAPTLTWNSLINDGDSFYFGSVPTAPTCTASDSLSGLDGSCVVGGYSVTVGSHTLIATAKDNAGNQSTETRSYSVLGWTLRGFYQPVDMNGVYNIVKGGSTVPLKFEIFAGNTELTDVANIESLTYAQTACDATVTTDEIETIATGGTSLRYADGQFIYNWKTPKTAGKCYRVTMTTIDGSSLVAYFKLK